MSSPSANSSTAAAAAPRDVAGQRRWYRRDDDPSAHEAPSDEDEDDGYYGASGRPREAGVMRNGYRIPPPETAWYPFSGREEYRLARLMLVDMEVFGEHGELERGPLRKHAIENLLAIYAAAGGGRTLRAFRTARQLYALLRKTGFRFPESESEDEWLSEENDEGEETEEEEEGEGEEHDGQHGMPDPATAHQEMTPETTGSGLDSSEASDSDESDGSTWQPPPPPPPHSLYLGGWQWSQYGLVGTVGQLFYHPHPQPHSPMFGNSHEDQFEAYDAFYGGHGALADEPRPEDEADAEGWAVTETEAGAEGGAVAETESGESAGEGQALEDEHGESDGDGDGGVKQGEEFEASGEYEPEEDEVIDTY